MRFRIFILISLLVVLFAMVNGYLYFSSSNQLISLFSLEESKSFIVLSSEYNRRLYENADEAEKIILDREMETIKNRQAFLWLFDTYRRKILRKTLLFSFLVSLLFLVILDVIQYRVFYLSIRPLREITLSLRDLSDNRNIRKVSESARLYKEETFQYNILLDEIVQKKQQEQIILASENRNYISRMIIHEVKNGLSPLFLKLESALISSHDNEEKHFYEDLLKAVQRLETVISQFRGLTHLPSPCLEICNLPKILNDLIDNNNWSRQRIFFSGNRFEVIADPFYLNLLFLNLIKNSLECKKESHVYIVFDQEEKKRVCISDDGPGFSDEAKQNLTKPGFTTKKGGEGYGMFLVREIAELLGLSLDFSNNSERGGAAVYVGFKR